MGRVQNPAKVDLSEIDFDKLREEFAAKVQRKRTALQDIREVIEAKLAQMLANNPTRMDYYKRYQEIIADYNREKDRVTVEATFAALVELAAGLDTEQGVRPRRVSPTTNWLCSISSIRKTSRAQTGRS